MKTNLSEEQAKNLIRLGVKISSADTETKGNVSWSLPALLNLFPCSKSSPIFELTRGGYGADGKFDKNWLASLEYNEVDKYYCHIAKEPIDAVYKLLCEYLENKTNNKKKK